MRVGRTASRLFLLATLAATGCGDAPEPPASPPVAPEAEVEPSTPAVSVGALAPDFTLDDLDGTPFTLSDHRGEIVVLNFWATWCLPCLAEMPDFEALHQQFGNDGIQVVGISQDTGGADEVRPFAERLGVTYPLLPDPSFTVSTQFGGVPVLPTTLFIDRDGTVAHEEMGTLSARAIWAVLTEIDPTLRLD